MPGLGLSPLLERLRRVRLPPGAAAGMLAVPSSGDELTGEAAILFVELDEIDEQRETLLAIARSDADRTERAAARERDRLLVQAREDGEQRAQHLLDQRRARAQRRIGTMLAEADQEAARVRARARRSTPKLVADIVERFLEDAS
jgi:vacuolar-type H+-ATPase subunit H